MVINFDRAEITARRASSAPVLINDSVNMEYRWTTLLNGDTLTFADGSRYTFYNLYNQRNIDEIVMDEDHLVHYIRRNVMEDELPPQGQVSMLLHDTPFDRIDHDDYLYYSDQENMSGMSNDMSMMSEDGRGMYGDMVFDEMHPARALRSKYARNGIMPEAVPSLTLPTGLVYVK